MPETRIRGDPALGKTRWRRFLLAALAPFGAFGLIAGLMASGAVALPIAISGTTFTVTADSLSVPASARGPGAFTQYGAVDLGPGGPTAVAVTELRGAVLANLQQTICLPLPAPLTGGAKMVISANPATASDMVVDATSLSGNASFDNFKIGVPVTGRDGSTIGQTADNVTITGLSQTAVYTSAGTFSLTGLHLGLSFVGGC